MNRRELMNGVLIPEIGYGTWQTPDGETAVNGVKAAIQCGYRHIDAAACYENERSVGQGIRESGIRREELFVTSKVWNTDRGYDRTIAACEKTLSDLGLDYLDMYLIHWPAAPHQFDNWEDINRDTWRAMTDLYKSGKVRAIGVSNFKPHHLRSLMEFDIIPMTDQIEFHPGFMQKDIVDYCEEHGILIEAYSPLGTGKMLNNETLMRIAEKYNKSVAQICIRWSLQHNIVPLPKSVTPSRIAQNIDVYGFELSDEDVITIDSMEYCGGSGNDPDKVAF